MVRVRLRGPALPDLRKKKNQRKSVPGHKSRQVGSGVSVSVDSDVARGVLSKLMMIIPTCTPLFFVRHSAPLEKANRKPAWAELSWVEPSPIGCCCCCCCCPCNTLLQFRARSSQLVACIIIMRMRTVGAYNLKLYLWRVTRGTFCCCCCCSCCSFSFSLFFRIRNEKRKGKNKS